ncbi:hypothetical protein I5L56_00525 [Pseudomonas oryzihabitans]|uniref:hypothetical protein n=1 Tax=Pseudomonas oryzihabitans TaxID=47885 RepID=UPI0018D7097F|nr:hypothetical protein [Pseudomonas oryzihabitans]MBH3328095.1 hypothetical protein [Pseudomonas oryzihabitans]
MPRLSLAEVVDVISRAADQKRTKISQVKKKTGYAPQFDFYKPLRECVVRSHKSGDVEMSLKSLVCNLTDVNKKNNYPKAIKGYLRWYKKLMPSWTSTETYIYKFLDVEVNVNPEMGILIDDKPCLVKLYFKDEQLSKLHINVYNALMRKAFGENRDVAVLDVRRAKLHISTLSDAEMEKYLDMIDAEFSYISAMWDKV